MNPSTLSHRPLPTLPLEAVSFRMASRTLLMSMAFTTGLAAFEK